MTGVRTAPAGGAGGKEARMAFRVVAAVSCAAAAILAASAAGAVDIRVTGGYTRVAYGDYNTFADGVNTVIAADPTITGELGAIRWIPEIGLEATVPVAPPFSLGAGAGVLWGSSSFEFSAGGSTLSFEHTVKAYPLTATVYADLPAPFAFAKPYAFAGGGAYYATVGFEERLGGTGDVVGYDAELSAWGFGLHGGAGLSFAVAPRIGLDLGVRLRYAKIKGFEGTATSTEGETADVVLGYFEGGEGYMIYGPVRADEAAGTGEGSVDLGGFGVSLGLRVAF
ncbi:MAG: hypothetical protein C4574_07600 [Candidatus Latescibacterota bacterium]|nr:MAG: hypothetical protein C4574_07600 [Candidatus Latescibacterota bacterium]